MSAPSATLLTIIQDVAAELGLGQPTTVTSNTDPQIVQLLALAKRELQELRQAKDWTYLQKLFVINLNTVTTDTGVLTNNSATITGLQASTITKLNALAATAWTVTDSGGAIPVSARVISASGTSVTMDSNATASNASASLQFSQDTYSLPTDFDHYIGNTWWDRTNRWALLGPDSPQVDQWHRSGISVIGPRRHFRQVGIQPTVWRIWPPLTTATTNAQELVFEYVSNNVVALTGNTSTLGPTFVNDTDIPIVDDQALRLGLKWRWLQVKRYQYADFQAEYIDYVDRLKARDGGNQVLSMSPMVDADYLVTSRNVQDGFYPGSSSITGQ